MSLTFSGKQQETDTGVSIEAFDGDKRMLVKASREAIDDYGLSAVCNCARDKYDRGDLTPEGFVQVWTDDLKGARGVGGLPIDD